MFYAEDEVDEARKRIHAIGVRLAEVFKDEQVRDVLNVLANEAANVLLSQSSWPVDEAQKSYAELQLMVYEQKKALMMSDENQN